MDVPQDGVIFERLLHVDEPNRFSRSLIPTAVACHAKSSKVASNGVAGDKSSCRAQKAKSTATSLLRTSG